MENAIIVHMKNYSISLLIAAALIALASCSTSNDAPALDENTTAPENEQVIALNANQFNASGMKLGKMENRPFHQVVKANGSIDVPPKNKASVSTYFAGTVKDIQLITGDKVKKGQTLFILENPEYVQLQQEYLEVKGQIIHLYSDYERQKNLAEDNVTSQKNFLKAESDYTVAKIKAESLSKKLTMMNINPKTLTIETIQTYVNITSPLNGYVTQINITQGTYLNPSEVAITIVDTGHLHLELNIFEKDLAKVSVGQAIKFKIQEELFVEYDATVHVVNKSIDPESRTIGIHGHLVDEKLSENLNPGMYVEAEIFTTSATKASLPQNAIVEIEGKYFVLVLDKSSNDSLTFLRKEIITGETDNEYTEILNHQDFNSDTEFLVSGAFNLITE